jgi:hypothetical protein
MSVFTHRICHRPRLNAVSHCRGGFDFPKWRTPRGRDSDAASMRAAGDARTEPSLDASSAGGPACDARPDASRQRAREDPSGGADSPAWGGRRPGAEDPSWSGSGGARRPPQGEEGHHTIKDRQLPSIVLGDGCADAQVAARPLAWAPGLLRPRKRPGVVRNRRLIFLGIGGY